MHMSSKLITFRQLSEDTGVSYRTMLAWNKSRPELMIYILKLIDRERELLDEVFTLCDEKRELQYKLNHINKLTKV